jgi:integrase
MSLYKRGHVYWTVFGIDGAIFRKPLGTSNWQEAKRKEKELMSEAETGKVSASGTPFARLPFDQANEQYRRDRSPRLAEATRRSELDHSAPLCKFFGKTDLNKITDQMIRDYIAKRHGSSVTNASINCEFFILRGMLKRAKRWHRFAGEVKPLPVNPNGPGRALEPDERLKLLRTAESDPRWMRAAMAAQLALNTTMRLGEIRKLQWKDVDLIERWIHVRVGKTATADRDIPLNPEAFAAVLKLREQAKALFGDQLSPDWFLFFWWLGAAGQPDPTRPTKSWRRAWDSLVKAAGLGRLRFHDLRHTAITDLSEGEASEQTIMAISGHLSRKMLEHYSHIRKQARRAAVEGLYRKNRDTAQVTTQLAQNDLASD